MDKIPLLEVDRVEGNERLHFYYVVSSYRACSSPTTLATGLLSVQANTYNVTLESNLSMERNLTTPLGAPTIWINLSSFHILE